MQFSTICSECKEMFLFTDDLLYVRPMTPINGKIRPLCFRCSTTVGSCHAYSLRCTEVRLTDKKCIHEHLKEQDCDEVLTKVKQAKKDIEKSLGIDRSII